MSSVWLVYTPPLWRWSAKKLCKFQQLTRPAGLGAGSFFFFPLSHFPAMFWTAFLQTSYSPWGIVSAWWDWMIVLIHKGMESDSNQGTQRKLRSQVQQWVQLKCGELCSLSDFLAPPRGVFFCGRPEMELPWQLSGVVTVPRGHFCFLFSNLSTFRRSETFNPGIVEMQKRCDQVALSLCWLPLWPDEE